MNEGPDRIEGHSADAPFSSIETECTSSAALSARIEADLARLKPEESGGRIGSYKLLQQIGEGGFGTVWMAEQTEPMKRRVALKIIKLGMDTKEVIARFEQERQALAMMEHPNIAKVLDAGATPFGRPFFAMELVRGIKITDYCDQNRLSATDRLRLFIAVCHAVQHAHQKGIIHRDLKPSNILVTVQDGEAVPKVIDFGVAKAVQSQGLTELTLFTQFEQMIGTPLYMSPEQAEMSGLDIDTRSDIYSLGVLLFELLTGRTPFDPEKLMRQGIDEMRRVIREEDPPKPSAFVSTMDAGVRTTVAQLRHAEPTKLISQIRGDLDCIVMMALEKDRSQRYETANGLADDIQRHLAHEPVRARPPSQFYRFRRMVRRNQLAFSATAAVALALIGGLSFSIWSFHREQQQRQIADEQRGTADEQRKLAKARALDAFRNEEHGRRLLYASDMNLAQQAIAEQNLGRARRLLDRHRPEPEQEDLRGWEWRFLWQQCRGEAFSVLTKRPERAFSVSFSSDGRHLSIGYYHGRVELWDIPGRRLTKALHERSGNRAHVAFSPVAEVLAATAGAKQVKLHDLAANRESILCEAPGVIRDLAFSYDGTRLAVLARRDTDQVRTEKNKEAVLVIDIPSGQVAYTADLPTQGNMHFNNARLSPDGERLFVTAGSFTEPKLRCVKIADGTTLWEKKGRDIISQNADAGFSAMDISPDGKLLATAMGYNSTKVQLWSTENGERLGMLDGHSDWICQLVFSRDGATLISACADQTVRLWDTATWREARVPLRGNGDEVHAVALTADNQTLATGCRDGTVMLWDARNRKPLGGRQMLGAEVVEAHALPGGRTILVREKQGRSALVDLETLRETELPFPPGKPWKFAAPNFVGVAEAPTSFRLFELSDTKASLVAEFAIEPRGKSGIAYCAPQGLLAWTPDTKRIQLTKVAQPDEAATLVSSNEPIEPARFSEDGRILLALTPGKPQTKLARIWDVATRQRLTDLERYLAPSDLPICERSANSVSSAEMLRWLAITPPSTGGTPSGNSPAFAVPTEITDRALSHDGRTFAVSTQHGVTTLYDAAVPEKLATLHGRQAAVFGLAFSPEGDRLAVANDVLWDVKTRQELLRLNAEGALHYHIEFTDDGGTLLVGSPDDAGTFQFWRAPSWEEVEDAERTGSAWPRSER